MASLAAKGETKTTTTTDDNGTSETIPPTFDEEETKAIEQLRNLVHEKYSDDEDFSSYLESTPLWRYLIARDFDIEQARTMFEESIEWKKRINLKKKFQENKEQLTHWSSSNGN